MRITWFFNFFFLNVPQQYKGKMAVTQQTYLIELSMFIKTSGLYTGNAIVLPFTSPLSSAGRAYYSSYAHSNGTCCSSPSYPLYRERDQDLTSRLHKVTSTLAYIHRLSLQFTNPLFDSLDFIFSVNVKTQAASFPNF